MLSQYSIFKFGTLLQKVALGEEIKYGDIVDINVNQVKQGINDNTFERTYPIFMHKKVIRQADSKS